MTDKFDNEPEVIKALNNRQTIEAIKLLRASRGISLKKAKDLVDQYIEEHGLSKTYIKNTDSTLGLILIAALALLGYYFLKNHV